MKNLTRHSTDYPHEKHDHVSSQFLENEEEITQLQDSLLKEETERQLAYWKQQLDGTSPVLQLPTDRPRQAVQSFQAAHYTFQLPEALTEAVKALSQQEGVTLFMTMLAAFQALLYRYTGQRDLLVGAVDSGHVRAADAYSRNSSVNTLVLRTSIDGHSPFQVVLRHVQQVVLEGQAYQDMALEQVLEALQLERDLSRQPLYQVLFVLEAALEGAEEAPDLYSVNDAANYGVARFELALFVQDSIREIRGEIEYNSDLFKPETIERMAGHWQKLLEGIVADSNQPIDALTLLTDAEWQEQVVEWNATQTAYPQNRCLHELFEEQVERTPEAVSIAFEQEQLTYRELNQRANQLAHHLVNLGVTPDTLVALLIERSIEFVVAILAVFKAGGAFLPLDPQHPAKRHSQILEQSHCSLVLTIDKFGTALTEALGEIDVDRRPQVIHLERLSQQGESEENLPLRSAPGNLAYVMFTSGSTGVPKGAMVEQVGMVNHIYAKMRDLALSEHDRVAQNGPPCFDIVVWQCLAALLVGGSVHIFGDEIALDPMQLLEQIEDKKITVLQAVPSILRAVVQQAEVLGEERPRLTNLRWVVPTGDALPPELCRQWLQLYPAIPLLNTYGSTECSDDQCHYAIYQPPPLDYALPIMSIGRPIQNMRTYVLDQRLMPIPIGVVGDLYVGGIGVGRGYLHDAERTAEVFLPDPFSRYPGARLYKTRDRARYLSDGLLEFLGRSDNLVKVQGVRIEPGEIEAILERHPTIREAVVIAREGVGGNKYLVAYVVPAPDQAPTSEELRRWLREKLPAYMIPSAFVSLKAFPLNSNGKVDRRALPAPEPSRSEANDNYVAPTLSQHYQLVQIWEDLLGVHPIGIKDDFFDLGGHSLLTVRLFDRIARVFGKKLPLSTLYGGATIEHLAAALIGEAKADSWPPLLTVQAGGSRRPFFYLHGQWEEELSFHCYPLARALGTNQPFYALKPYPLDGRQGLPTMEDIAAAHIEAIRAVQPEGPYLLGGWCNGGLVAYEMARQLQAQGQVLDLLVILDPPPLVIPFNWRWDRIAYDRLGRMLRLSEEKRLDWYLRLKHLGRTLRYKLLRREDLEHLAFSDLSQSYPRLFDWIATGYRPLTLYDGKVTFFWTEAIYEAKTDVKGWRKVEAGGKIEVHIISGDHMTSRSEYLPVLAEQLDFCVREAQGTAPERDVQKESS
jgi:amino acid adenylation domain-containing protein